LVIYNNDCGRLYQTIANNNTEQILHMVYYKDEKYMHRANMSMYRCKQPNFAQKTNQINLKLVTCLLVKLEQKAYKDILLQS